MEKSLAERLKIDKSQKYEPIFYNESCLVSRLVSGMKKKYGELGYEKANGIRGWYWMEHNGVLISCYSSEHSYKHTSPSTYTSEFTYTCGNVEIKHKYEYSEGKKGDDVIQYIVHLGDKNGSIIIANVR